MVRNPLNLYCCPGILLPFVILTAEEGASSSKNLERQLKGKCYVDLKMDRRVSRKVCFHVLDTRKWWQKESLESIWMDCSTGKHRRHKKNCSKDCPWMSWTLSSTFTFTSFLYFAVYSKRNSLSRVVHRTLFRVTFKKSPLHVWIEGFKLDLMFR